MKNIKEIIHSLSAEGRKKKQQKEGPKVPEGNNPAKGNGLEEKKDEVLSNQHILNKITSLFRNELQRNSFDEMVTFPMTFTVAMSPTDIIKYEGYMPLIAELAIKNFYRIIKEEMKGERPCANMSTYWDISFIPCVDGVTEIDEEVIKIAEGKIMVFSTVNDTIEDIKESENGANVTMTYSGTDVFANVNINRAILKNMLVVGPNRFRFEWDQRMSEDFRINVAQDCAGQNTDNEINKPSSGFLALFTCNYQNTTVSYEMRQNRCIISGEKDDRTDENIFKLPCKMVKNGHIEIEYNEKSGKFMMAAYGKTTVDGRKVDPSTSGDVKLIELPDRANLGLSGVVMVNFKKKVV